MEVPATVLGKVVVAMNSHGNVMTKVIDNMTI